MRQGHLLVALIVLAAATPANAQLSDSSRVRVSVRGGAEYTGTLLSARNDTLRVRPEGSTGAVSIALDSVSALDVSDGMQRHMTRYGLVGAGAGLLIGAATAYMRYEPCTGWCIMDYGAGGDAFFGGVAGMVAGGVVGAAVGAIKQEQWRSVPVPSRSSVSVMPLLDRRRVGVVATLSF